MKIPLGTIRTCECGKQFEHFNRGRHCPECNRAIVRGRYRKRRSTPGVAAHDNLKTKARMERNKRVVLDYLKTCRCKNCRESNPLCLRIFKPDGKIWPIGTYNRHTLTVFKLKPMLKDCTIQCLNCWAAGGSTRGVAQILRATA